MCNSSWTSSSNCPETDLLFFPSSWALLTQLTEVHILEKQVIVWTLHGLWSIINIFSAITVNHYFLETIMMLLLGLLLFSVPRETDIFFLEVTHSHLRLLPTLIKGQIHPHSQVIWFQWGPVGMNFYLQNYWPYNCKYNSIRTDFFFFLLLITAYKDN